MDGDDTPSGQACTADSGHTRRNGAKHHVQQDPPHRPPRTNAEANTTQNNREFTVFNVATQERWKDDKGEKETRTEWHRVYPWGVLSKYASKLEKGQLITLKGTLRYREAETEQHGKQHFAEIHASSIKRLSRVEAHDDFNDVAEEE